MRNRTWKQFLSIALSLALIFSLMAPMGGFAAADEPENTAAIESPEVSPILPEPQDGEIEAPPADSGEPEESGESDDDVLDDSDKEQEPLPEEEADGLLASAAGPLSEEILYAINVIPPTNGALTAEFEDAERGSTVILTITPDEGYNLKPGSLSVLTDVQQAPRLVRGAGTEENPYTFIMPADSVTVRVEFIRICNVTIDPNIVNGIITTDISSGVAGEKVNITVTPDDGYRLKFNSTTNQPNKTLKVTGVTSNVNVSIADWFYTPETNINLDLNAAATSYSFTMPNDDVIITAEFTEPFALIAVAGMENGNINFNGRTVAGAGERVPIGTTPNAGYKLKDGSLSLIDSDGEPVTYNSTYGEFIMPASDVTITAEFEVVPALEGINLKAVGGDSEAVLTWDSMGSWKNYMVHYRIKDSGDAYKTQGFYNTLTGTVSGLTNDVEYEFYILLDGAVSDLVYAATAGIMPTGVTLTQNSVNVVLGQTVQLYATVAPSTTKSTTVTWTSDNEDVAVVGEHGMVETKALGTATITVTTNAAGKTATCVVTVVSSSDVPAGGSMIIGDANAQYNDEGGTVQIPLTVTIPTNRPIFEFDFNLNINNYSSDYHVYGISLDGEELPGRTTTTVGNSKIKINNLPLTTADYNGWCVVTPAEGRFLEAGKVYNFVLTIKILNTATPTFNVSFGNSGNYSSTFYYYDYDYSPNRDRFTNAEVRKTGRITAEWTGEGIPFSGTGDTTTYFIAKPSDLLWYAEQINSGIACRATLYADIDLTDTEFDGIGTAENRMGSLFSGNGYSVTYNMNQSEDGAVGFIRYMANGTIRDLTVKGAINVTGGTVNVGGVVGELRNGAGNIASCKNEMTINVTGSGAGNVGGIVGYIESTRASWDGNVSGSVNLGTIMADAAGVTATGGIVGYTKNSSVGSSANGGTNRATTGTGGGSVTGRGFVGGIVGIMDNSNGVKDFSDNTNFGSIIGLSGEATGGIAGKIISANVGGTYNGASITEYANRNYGAVSGATRCVGGIAGCVDNSAAERFALNYNAAQITSTSAMADSAVGGIIGHTTGSETVIITNNTSSGTVAASGGATQGGVLGKADAALSADLCIGNYYSHAEGLEDAAYGEAVPASWLSIEGFSPLYSGTGGDGSEEDPYQIATINDFLWLTKQVNSGTEPGAAPGRNYNVILVTDIDLTEYPGYEGLGTDSYPSQEYCGIFDGNGHTITVALDGSSTGGQARGGRMAIFRSCTGATIKNLTVEGTVTGSRVAGVALTFNGGTMENVHNYADITDSHSKTTHTNAGQAAGIICGSSPARMTNVTNHGKIDGHNAAGIANTVVVTTVIDDCHNYGDITGCMIAAGIVGSIGAGEKSADGKPSLIIKNTTNNGTVTSLAPVVLDNVAWYNNADPSTNHTAGGIVGKVDNAIVEFNNVTNNGTVQGTGNNIGGILGTSTFGDYQDTDFRVINSTNNGDIISLYDGDDPWYLSHINVGGIVGNTSGNFDPSSQWNPHGTPGHTQKATVIGSVNNGNVSGPEGINKGAIVGLISGNESSTINVDNDSNYSSVDVGDEGRNPVKGNPYNPETHKVENGVLVEKQPEPKPPVDGGNGNNDDYSPAPPTAQLPSPPPVVTRPPSPPTSIPDPETPLAPASPEPTAQQNENPAPPQYSPPPVNRYPQNLAAAPSPTPSAALPDIVVREAEDSDSTIADEETDDEPEPEIEPEATAEPEPEAEERPDVVRETVQSNAAVIVIIIVVIAAAAAVIGLLLYRKRSVRK